MLTLCVLSCEAAGDSAAPSEEPSKLGTVRQAITDTDGDGMDDSWEISYFGNLSQTSSGDYDADGMTNGEEYQYGFNPTVNDAFADADGDRYPNVYEVRNSANPNDSSSIPTPTYTVNGSGGGSYTNVVAAVNAASTSNGMYQIIGIAPGTYTGVNNNISVSSSKPQLLLIGLQGPAKTIIDGVGLTGGDAVGWGLHTGGVVASLTIRNFASTALHLDPGSLEVRLVDLYVHDNGGNPSYGGGLEISSGGRVSIFSSTFINNTGRSAASQIYVGAGTTTITNSVVWNQQSGTLVGTAGSATVSANYSLVKGQSLTGTGNIPNTTDPKILTGDAHITWDSPLRAAGATVSQSRIDFDEESRPTTGPDIGVDQFVDTDGDDLADEWELAYAGNLTTLTGLTQDADGDGLTNDQEYDAKTNPLVADTDGDGVSDGDEINVYGTNPLGTDSDGDDMPDGWEVSHSLNPAVANAFEDADGDRYPNVFEYAGGTDPSNASSTPTPNFTVDPAGTYSNVTAAVNAANISNGKYQIIGIAPGVYTGVANNISVSSSKPRLLLIGLQGATRTVIDGTGLTGGDAIGWGLHTGGVVASLTIRNFGYTALHLDPGSLEIRLVDLFVHDNGGNPSYGGGIEQSTGGNVYVVGSTFINNVGRTAAQQIYVGAGTATISNSVVWNQATGTLIGTAGGATVSANYSLVKGQTLSGTGNLANSTDPSTTAGSRSAANGDLIA